MNVAGPVTGSPRGLVSVFDRRDRITIGALFGVIAVMHLVGFGVLVLVVAARGYHTGPSGAEAFGIGLGMTAYLFGLRHGFDADHIAAIDNTTRKLMSDGQKPTAVGFWFAVGHSTVVLVMALLVVAGTRTVGALVDDGSTARRLLGLTGTLASGLFLCLIAVMNIIAMAGIWRAFRRLRRGDRSGDEVDVTRGVQGLLARLLRPIMRRITRPVQMYPVGVLFGLGFDTATEIALLALAGGTAAAGLPWYAVLVLPLLFAAGMALTDTADGLLMIVAYDWAFLRPARRIVYDFAVTGLSIAVALLIGSIELASILHDGVNWTDPVTTWISGISLNSAGLVIAGMFAVTWLGAIASSKLGVGRVTRRG